MGSPAVSVNRPEVVEPGRRSGELDRRASLNATAAALDYGARAAVELAVNPVLVGGLGTYLYGAWRTLYRMTGYLWAASGRSAQALQIAVARRQAVDDPDAKQRLVGAAVSVWFVFLPLLTLVGAVGVWFTPNLLDTPEHHVGAVRWAAALLWIDAVVLALAGIPKAVLQGENLGYKRMGLTALLVAATGVATATAVEADTGIVGVSAVNLAGTVLTGVVFVRVVRRHVPWFAARRPHRDELRSFLGVSAWFTGWKFVNQLILAGDVAILAIAGSVSLVTDYSLTKFAPEAALPLLSLAVQGIMPGLGGIVGAGQSGRARRVRAEIMAGVWVLATAAGVTILVTNQSFVRLWVGAEFFAGSGTNLLIVVSLLQLAIIRTDAAVIDLTLDIRRKVVLGAVSVGITIVLGTMALRVFDAGIAGLVVALIVGRLLLTVEYPRLVGRALDVGASTQLRAAVRPLAATAALLGTAHLIGRQLRIDAWLVFVPAVTAVALVAVPLVAAVGLAPSARRRLFGRAQRLVAR